MDPKIETNAKAPPFSPSATLEVENGPKTPPFSSPSADIESGVVLVVVVEDGTKEMEELCRICHLRSELGSEMAENEGAKMIQIGCDCKGELGGAHRQCAEAWFRVRGNRYCEICGGCAKNINGEGYMSFMDTWHDTRMVGRNSGNSEQSSCWRGRPCFNFLLACLVIAFIIAWFFRVDII